MNVEQFVAETLRQVVAGICKAQEATAGTGAAIVPATVELTNKDALIGRALVGDNWLPMVGVDFDVAVVVTEGAEGGGGAKLTIPFLSVQAGGTANAKTEATSRIRFQVPLVLPGDAATTRAADDLRRQQDEQVAASLTPRPSRSRV